MPPIVTNILAPLAMLLAGLLTGLWVGYRWGRSKTKEPAGILPSHDLPEGLVDPLTDLPNRRAFDRMLKTCLAQAHAATPLSLLIVDVDRFKRVNDQHGHVAGDAVLCHVAKTLATTMRQSDLVTRIGGDEFGIVLTSTSAEQAAAAAQCACRAFHSSAAEFQGQSLDITVSCGAAEALSDESAVSLLQRADAALYAAKAAGRNTTFWHNGRVGAEGLVEVSGPSNRVIGDGAQEGLRLANQPT